MVYAPMRMYRRLLLWICATYRSLNWQSIRASCILCSFLINAYPGYRFVVREAAVQLDNLIQPGRS